MSTTDYTTPTGVRYCPTSKTTGWVLMRFSPDPYARHNAQADQDKKTDAAHAR